MRRLPLTVTGAFSLISPPSTGFCKNTSSWNAIVELEPLGSPMTTWLPLKALPITISEKPGLSKPNSVLSTW